MRILVLLLLALNFTAAQAHYWVSTNLMTEIVSIDPETIKLKVTELDDANKHAYPVGTVLTLKNKKWTKKSGFNDEKVVTRLAEVTYPNGNSAPENKTITIKPRSSFERMAWLVFGLVPQTMQLKVGDPIIVFDTAKPGDTTLTAIKDPTL